MTDITDITDITKARRQFETQRDNAARRGIGFELTFEQWCEIWESSGKYPQRGTLVGQYGMQRYWDSGPYRVGNVEIGTPTENQRTRGNRGTYRRVRGKGLYQARSERLSFIERGAAGLSPEEILMEEEEEIY